MYEKYYDAQGRVAVLTTGDHFPWAWGHPNRMFDREFVEIWLGEGDDAYKMGKIVARLKQKYGYMLSCIPECLKVWWIPQGVQFRIHEYDGDETVVLLEDEEYFTA